jgi:hypothetical protein
MKDKKQQSTRRKFITMGASSAAVLLGSNALANQANSSVLATRGMQIDENTITKENVEQMRADVNLKAGDKVYTLGYHRPGDDGDNVYIVVENSTVKADGGEYIDLASNGLKAQGLFPGGIIRVEQFGAIGVQSNNPMIDNSRAMHNAHATGQVIFYAAKQYGFNRLNIAKGGIIGRGENTILVSSNKTEDIITYQGSQKNQKKEFSNSGLEGQFKDFTLLADKLKTTGAGLRLDSMHSDSAYNALIQNLTIKNTATGIYVNKVANYVIKDCYIDSYSGCGIYLHGNKNSTSAQVQTIRGNSIQNNVLVTEYSKAIGIKYRGKNTKISSNKIVGGSVGVEISPLSASPLVHINDNAIENQDKYCIHVRTEADFIASSEAHFSQVLISQNRLNVSSAGAAAIYVAPEHFTLTDMSINNNLIRYHGKESTTAAINIQNSNRFMLNNNSINCHQGAGFRGIYISQDCSNGILSANHVILPLNGHTLNLSPTTTMV